MLGTAGGRKLRGLATPGLDLPRRLAFKDGEPRGVGDCVLRMLAGRAACASMDLHQASSIFTMRH